MVSPIRQIELLSERLERARQLVSDGKVHTVLNQDGHYCVESSTPGAFWLVNGECGCPDAVERTDIHRGFCKHRLAVELFKEQLANTDAKTTKRKTKKQQTEDDVESLYRKEAA